MGMRLLVNSKAAERYYTKHPDWFGWLFTPTIKNIPSVDIPYYSDNGAFSASKVFSAASFERHITYCKGIGVHWITVPDVVGSSKETTKLFYMWLDKIQSLPLAYVLQDGVTLDEIPFDDIVCVFLGGSTEFKLSSAALELCYKAKERGKLVHIGRVNSIKRIRQFRDVMDTCDGSGWSRFADAMLPKYITYRLGT
jgi:hypothetical protein